MSSSLGSVATAMTALVSTILTVTASTPMFTPANPITLVMRPIKVALHRFKVNRDIFVYLPCYVWLNEP